MNNSADIYDLAEQYLRQDELLNGNASFVEKRVQAYTLRNKGVINDHNGKQYKNKCFFLALSTGLFKICNIRVSAYTIAKACHMLNNDMMDTDNETHLKYIEILARRYDIRLDFFIGVYDKAHARWMTLPYPQRSIGTDGNIIRILNKGDHFEYLEDVDRGFVSNTIDVDLGVAIKDGLIQECQRLERYIEEQDNIDLDIALAQSLSEQLKLEEIQERQALELARVEAIRADAEFAARLTAEEFISPEILEMQRAEAIRADAEFAARLAAEDLRAMSYTPIYRRI